MKMKETDYSSYNENKKCFFCMFSKLNIMIMHLSCLLEAEDIMDLQKISQVEMCVYLGQYGKFIYSKGKNNKLFQINYPLCNIR